VLWRLPATWTVPAKPPTPAPVPASEIETRRENAGRELPARKLDALLVGFGPNLRYLTGFTGSNGMLLLWNRGAIFFTDPRYTIQAADQVTCQSRICTGPMPTEVIRQLRRRKFRRVGFEHNRMSFDTYQTLSSGLPAQTSLVPASGLVERMRMIKSGAEIGLMRESVRLNSVAFEQAVSRVRPGMSESRLAADLEYRMRRLGAEKPAFETIVASGPRSALPHADPTGAPMEQGHLVMVDMGAQWNGYCSDMTRMLFIGEPGRKVRRMYAAVLDAQLAAVAAVKPGIPAAAVDRAARQVLKAAGLDRAFVHSTGHGLGLEIHEAPRLGKKEKLTLEAGMAVTIEPGVYLEGVGGVRIEDTVVVTPAGCDVLTPTSKELLQI
jgi:Xaa-Pro aminopeptidase